MNKVMQERQMNKAIQGEQMKPKASSLTAK